MRTDLIWIWIAVGLVHVRCDEHYHYSTKYLATPLDHFSFSTNATFQLRYLINDTYWRPDGPIFFYTGNEGDIELFAQNTGFIWDIAPSFSALVVFAEHRYYGKSLPFGDKSYSDVAHLGYLTSTQALADYVYLLDDIQRGRRQQKGRRRCPVIAFGGSYGGMLAAWMRLKYPYVIDGAVASSAPVFQFQGLTPCGSFNNIVASVFKISSAKNNCVQNIKRSWPVIRNITSSNEGKAWLTNEWKLCKPLNSTQDVLAVTDVLEEIYGNVAMINYPYATNFLKPVPAYPVRAICERIDDATYDGKELLTKLGKAISIYTNYTGTEKCLDVDTANGNLGDTSGWDFQACTEIMMPLCTDERNPMFERRLWDLKQYTDKCRQTFGTSVTRDDLAILQYGGREADYSNVVFTNGLWDPWSPGGYLKNGTQSVYSILIHEAAHHLDLRGSNRGDTVQVINARLLIRNIVHVWLKIFNQSY